MSNPLKKKLSLAAKPFQPVNEEVPSNNNQNTQSNRTLSIGLPFQPASNYQQSTLIDGYQISNPIFEQIQPYPQSNTQEVHQQQGKGKKLLRPTNYTFQPDPLKEEEIRKQEELKKQQELQKQLEAQKQKEEEERLRQEELKKQEELRALEELKQKEEMRRGPKPYSKEQLEHLIQSIEDFSYFEMDQIWIKMGERKHHDIKEMRRNDQRKESKIPTQKKEPKYDQNFDKGTKMQQIQPELQQPQTKQPTITRQAETIQQKLLKDKIKQEAEAWVQLINETPEQKQLIEKDLKYRLNQLAPDNYNAVSKMIIDLVEKNPEFTDFLAERIIEKAQLETKYRTLYTKLCSQLAQLQKLQQISESTQGRQKTSSRFKSSLLGKVQQMFQSRKIQQIEMSNMSVEEKNLSHLIRKKKIMGNVRFIGGLYLEQLLPIQALQLVVAELIGEYTAIYNPQQETSEESIEGLIELIDQIGISFKNSERISNETSNLIGTFLNGSKSQENFMNIFKDVKKTNLLDLVSKIFEKLKQNYKLSQRIQLLIENLLDKIQKGWEGVYSRRDEEAQSLQNTHDVEEEDPLELQLQQQQNSRTPKKENGQQNDDPQNNPKDISMFVESSFNIDADTQMDKLRKELKRISEECPQYSRVFFETFFQKMLQLRLVKKNQERAQLVYDILLMNEAQEEIVQKALVQNLNEDLVYDLSDSPAAKDLLVAILSCFINENDWNSLKKFLLKPNSEIQEFKDYLSDVANELTTKYSSQQQTELIQNYFKILGVDINTQSQ